MNTELKTNKAFNDALKIQDEKVARGKDIISHIAMTTSNNFEIVDSLMELMEMFVIYDSNIMIGDIAEDLQRYLFTWTREHGDGFSNWKESVLTGKKYQTDTSAEPSVASTPNDTAKQISDLLNNPNLPTRPADAIQEGLTDIYNTADNQSPVDDKLQTP
jgi:hypothetical protein